MKPDLQPTLVGETVELRPLAPADAGELVDAVRDPGREEMERRAAVLRAVTFFVRGQRRSRAQVRGHEHRIEHARRKRACFFENRFPDVGSVSESRQLRDFIDTCEFAQNELHIAQWGLVRAHARLSLLRNGCGIYLM